MPAFASARGRLLELAQRALLDLASLPALPSS